MHAYYKHKHKHTRACAHTHLGGFSEDEFGVFDQALQRDGDINDLGSLLLLAGVGHKLPIPGIQNDQTWTTRNKRSLSQSALFSSNFGYACKCNVMLRLKKREQRGISKGFKFTSHGRCNAGELQRISI